MYFSEEILKTIFNLSEDVDLSNQYSDYIVNCIQLGEQALAVYKAKEPEMTLDFIEDYSNLESEMDQEEPNLGIAIELLDKLRENEAFEKIYSQLLDNLNKNIISEAEKDDSDVKKRLQEYFESVEDAFLLNYYNSIIVPETEEYKNFVTEESVNSLNDTIANSPGDTEENALTN